MNEDTVAGWIRDILPNKNLNVATFRSSFVSYYYPKSNNQEKKVMAQKASSGQATTPIKIIDTPKVEQKEQVIINTQPQVKEITNIQEQRQINAKKKWYDEPKHREERKAKVREHSKDPLTYLKRYLRDLQSGRLDKSRFQPQQLKNIKLNM